MDEAIDSNSATVSIVKNMLSSCFSFMWLMSIQDRSEKYVFIIFHIWHYIVVFCASYFDLFHVCRGRLSFRQTLLMCKPHHNLLEVPSPHLPTHSQWKRIVRFLHWFCVASVLPWSVDLGSCIASHGKWRSMHYAGGAHRVTATPLMQSGPWLIQYQYDSLFLSCRDRLD